MAKEAVSIDEAVKSTLESKRGLKEKVFPLEAQNSAAAPFVMYELTVADEDRDLDGPTGLWSASFEIHCVERSYSALVKLSRSVRDALQAMQGKQYPGLLIEQASVRQASPDLRESEVNLYRRMYVLQLYYQEECNDE